MTHILTGDSHLNGNLTLSGTYVGFSSRMYCRCAADTNIALNVSLVGVVVDGVTLAAGDRLLLTRQSIMSENGIYIVGTTPQRSNDMRVGMYVPYITIVSVEGTTLGGVEWATGGTMIVGGNLLFIMKTLIRYVQGDLIYAATNRTLGRLAAPIVDSYLTYSGGTMNWSPISTTSAKQTIGSILTDEIANFTTYKTIGSVSWHAAIYGSAVSRVVYFYVNYVDCPWAIRVYTGSSDLGSTLTGNTSGFFNITFTDPGANELLQIQILRASPGGTAPIFSGIQVVIY